MSFAIPKEDLRAHTIQPEPRQSGITVEELVAQVAKLYEGKIFNRATEKDCFGLEGVIPLRLRGNLDQNASSEETKNPSESFGVHELFERCVKGKKDRAQLLIEGQAGSGKSTITRQLAALWQKVQFGGEPLTPSEEKLRAGFDRYKLVVRIPLSELGGEYPIHWEEYLFEQLDLIDQESFGVTLRSLLKERRVLFLLDDYSAAVDTIDFRATGIKDVLRTQHWMMTSRPDCYRGEGGKKFEQFEITGLSLQNVVEYIRGYFAESEKAESLIKFIGETTGLEEIIKVPLLLEILCFNWRENEEKVFSNATTTSLFQFLVFNILKKYLKSLDKDVRFLLSLDELLSERKVTHQDFQTAACIFMEFMEQAAFSHLMSDREKYSFRRTDPSLIEGVKAAIQKAHLPGVSVDCAGVVIDVLFDKLGLLKGVQNERGEFLHANLQEYFAGRHLAKCIQTSLEVSPGQAWRNWVDENKFNRNLNDVFRFAAGELDLRQDGEGLNALFSQILSEEHKSVFRTYENVLSARCLEEVRKVALPVRGEVMERLVDRFYLRDPHAVIYLLESPLVVGNKRYEDAICYNYNGPIGDFIKSVLRSSRSVPKGVVEYIMDRLSEQLDLFADGGSLKRLHERAATGYIKDIKFLGIQSRPLSELMLIVLRHAEFPEQMRIEAVRTLATQARTAEVEEVLFQLLTDDLCFIDIQVQAAVGLVQNAATRARIMDMIRNGLLDPIVLDLVDLLGAITPISQEIYSFLKELLSSADESICFHAAKALSEFYLEAYPEVEKLLEECIEKLGLGEEESGTVTVEAGDQSITWSSAPGLQEDLLTAYLHSEEDLPRNYALDSIKRNGLYSDKIVNALVDCVRSQSLDPEVKEKMVKLLAKVEPPRADVLVALTGSLQDPSVDIRRRAIKGIVRHYPAGKEVAQAILSHFQMGEGWKLTKLLREHLPKLGEVAALLLDSLKREEIKLHDIQDFLQGFPAKEILGWYFSGKMESTDFFFFLGMKIMSEKPLFFRREEFLYLEDNFVLEKFSLEGYEDFFEKLIEICHFIQFERCREVAENPSRKTEAPWVYRTALEMGDPRAHLLLAGIYLAGEGIEMDMEKGIHYLKTALDAGIEHAHCLLGVYYKQGVVVQEKVILEKNTEQAIHHLRIAADAGDEDASNLLGEIFDLGQDTKRDVAQAAKYYGIAADAGHIAAQGNLGELYQFEEEVRDLDKAIACFKAAADKESVDALFGLGYCHEVGAGTPVDLQEAKRCYDEAIRLGLLDLGKEGKLTYRYPGKVEVFKRLQSQSLPSSSEDEGEKYYMKACDLEFGDNPDLQRALNFYQLAADRGHPDAIERLKSRDEGLVEELSAQPNEDEAEKNYMKACELEFGDNPNLEEALNFYRLAASEGYADAIARLNQLEDGESDE